MKFACPNPTCDNGVGFGEARCSKCGFEFSIGGLLRHYLRLGGKSIRERALTKCPYPGCGEIIPITSRECPKCRKPLTVNAAFAPAKSRIHEIAAQRNPRVLRRIQVIYFLLSGVALLALLSYVSNETFAELKSNALMSVVYLVVILVLVRLFVNPQKVRVVISHISPLVRFTLILNYLTLLLVLQICIGTWWTKASILAGLFGTTFGSIYVLANYIWPLTAEAQSWFAAPPPEPGFNPSNPQGRSYHTDDRSQ